MATVSDIHKAIQAKLQAIGGLQAYDVWPDQPAMPCAVVESPSGDYDDTSDGGYAVHAEVLLLVAPAQLGLARGQRALDAYLAPTGTQSVKAAIDDGQYRVTGWREKGVVEVNGVPCIGCRFLVEVLA